MRTTPLCSSVFTGKDNRNSFVVRSEVLHEMLITINSPLLAAGDTNISFLWCSRKHIRTGCQRSDTSLCFNVVIRVMPNFTFSEFLYSSLQHDYLELLTHRVRIHNILYWEDSCISPFTAIATHSPPCWVLDEINSVAKCFHPLSVRYHTGQIKTTPCKI